jgi:hypothetical protein
MWTKRNDHASNNECANYIYIERAVLKGKESSLIILLSSLVFIFSSPPRKIHSKFIITIFLYHGPLPFSTKTHLFPLPPQTLLNYVNG